MWQGMESSACRLQRPVLEGFGLLPSQYGCGHKLCIQKIAVRLGEIGFRIR